MSSDIFQRKNSESEEFLQEKDNNHTYTSINEKYPLQKYNFNINKIEFPHVFEHLGKKSVFNIYALRSFF